MSLTHMRKTRGSSAMTALPKDTRRGDEEELTGASRTKQRHASLTFASLLARSDCDNEDHRPEKTVGVGTTASTPMLVAVEVSAGGDDEEDVNDGDDTATASVGGCFFK
jgi:hypothetical protein